MRRNKRKTTKMSLLMMLLLLGIGFAALTANLKINGTVDVSKASWDVHFENVSITEGSVTATTVPTSDDETTTEMTYAVNFTKPGDFYEFTVDMVNDGTIDAMVNLVSNTTYESDGTTTKNLPTYLRSSVTYNDGIPIVQNQKLDHGTSEKIKVRVEFRTDISASDLPDTADTIVFKFSGTFKQKDNNAVPVRVNFSTATWDEITTAYAGNPASLKQSMENGDTKTIQMDVDNDGNDETYHLRIANISTPAECSTQGFSQSACGLVLEFVEVVTRYDMNPGGGPGNIGGWEDSQLRGYMNSTLYNLLPSDLKSKIINTTVVSSHGSEDSSNFTTTDKLYLFSTHEIWEGPESSLVTYDTAYNQTRQLDYYKYHEVTTSSYSAAIKNLENEPCWWWMRTAYLDNDYFFFYADDSGAPGHYFSNHNDGVSPAFRIG